MIHVGSTKLTSDEARRQAAIDGKVAILAALDAHNVDFPPPVPAVCGDCVLDVFDDFAEDCDDGNTDDADGCQSDCMWPTGGDEIVDPDEECDDGNNGPGDGCSETCTRG